MENGNKPADKKPATTACCHRFDSLHWFVRLFLVAALAAFVLTVGIGLACTDGRHKGKVANGYYGVRKAQGGNMMYFQKGEIAGKTGCAQGGKCDGDCPMMRGTIQSLPGEAATFNTFTAPSAGAAFISSGVVTDVKDLTDMAEVFMVSGVVIKVSDTDITLVDKSKAEKTVSISAETKVKFGGQDGRIKDVQLGDDISAVILPGANGASVAQLIRILSK
jgi:hypothetical protein